MELERALVLKWRRKYRRRAIWEKVKIGLAAGGLISGLALIWLTYVLI